MIKRAKRDNWVDIAGYAGLGAECDERAQQKKSDPFEPKAVTVVGRKQVYP